MVTFNGVNNDLYLHNKSLNKQNFNIEVQDVSAEKIEYDFEPPLMSQIKYFLDNLDNPNINYVGGKEAIDVMNILHESSKQLT